MTKSDLKSIKKELKRIADALESSAKGKTLPQNLPEAGSRGFTWTPTEGFKPVPFMAKVQPGLLVGLEEEKKAFYDNFRRFAAGLPALDVLLWGERGAGKTSLVASLFEEFPDPGWALVNVGPAHINRLWELLEVLGGDKRRWLIFMDDLNFTSQRDESRDLKIFLEGGISQRPENTLAIATSNRRHLLPEKFPGSDAIHPDEDVSETISLADRFGLSIGFSPMDQDVYLLAVSSQLKLLKVGDRPAKWCDEALRFAMERGLRTGRTAAHFARFYAGKHFSKDPGCPKGNL